MKGEEFSLDIPLHRAFFSLSEQTLRRDSTGRYPIKADLARIANRAPRAMQSDIRALRDDWQAPLEFDHQKNGFYFTDPAWRLSSIKLSQGEQLGFFIAERI